MSNIFISYVRENQEIIDKLVNDLEAFGINVWLDRNNLNPGDRWQDNIKKAISNGNYFLACFSDEYYIRDKTYMNEELTLAIEELRKRSTERAWFIPVLLSDCRIPEQKISSVEKLSDIHSIELYKDWACGIQKLISVIKPNRIDQLKALINTKNVIYEKPYYFCKTSKGKDGPFCQRCYDTTNKLIRLQSYENGCWECYECHNNYYDNTFYLYK